MFDGNLPYSTCRNIEIPEINPQIIEEHFNVKQNFFKSVFMKIKNRINLKKFLKDTRKRINREKSKERANNAFFDWGLRKN